MLVIEASQERGLVARTHSMERASVPRAEERIEQFRSAREIDTLNGELRARMRSRQAPPLVGWQDRCVSPIRGQVVTPAAVYRLAREAGRSAQQAIAAAESCVGADTADLAAVRRVRVEVKQSSISTLRKQARAVLDPLVMELEVASPRRGPNDIVNTVRDLRASERAGKSLGALFLGDALFGLLAMGHDVQFVSRTVLAGLRPNRSVHGLCRTPARDQGSGCDVVLAADLGAEPLRFVAAHELAHAALTQVCDGSEDGERSADAFARGFVATRDQLESQP